MKKRMTTLALLTLGIIACSQVPVTERKQLNMVSSAQVLQMSKTQYDAFMQENKLSSNPEWSAAVKRLGDKISAVVVQHLRETNNSGRIDGFEWEFNVVQSEQKNAFAMPGGKVVIYEGIMQLLDGDDAELATVMSHEIAHVIAEHGNERMSQQLLAQMGRAALGAVTEQKSEMTQQLFMAAYGAGMQVGVLLPYSRKQESEADELGLIFMAKASYNPEKALSFWEKMNSDTAGAKPPEFLSTHPGAQTRINDIKKLMPKAMLYYEK